MGRVLAALLPVLLVLPSARAEMRGDDWEGSLAFAEDGAVYLYAFRGTGCGLPMWCWSIAEDFRVAAGGAVRAVPGAAAWSVVAISPASAVLHGRLVFDGAVQDVRWTAYLHSICMGAYEGPLGVTALGSPAGRAAAHKTGPGPDGHYECMPS